MRLKQNLFIGYQTIEDLSYLNYSGKCYFDRREFIFKEAVKYSC